MQENQEKTTLDMSSISSQTENLSEEQIREDAVICTGTSTSGEEADNNVVHKNKNSYVVIGITVAIIFIILLSRSFVSKSKYNELEAKYNDTSEQLNEYMSDLENLSSEYEEYKEKMKAFEGLSDDEISALVEQVDKIVSEKKAAEEKTAAEKKAAEEAAAKAEAEEKARKEAIAKATYGSGTYKVGSDIPAGEYVLFATGSGGYFSLNSDSTGSFDSIICNDNFDYNTIVTISDGQYFELKRAKAIPLNANPSVDTSGEGMFKVGVHIPAGEYKLSSSGSGYVQVSSDSSHSMDSIVTNDNFDGEKYITVSDGQYLTITRAKILK